MSCPAGSGCFADGDYTDASGYVQAFVITQRNGRWGKAIEVPGLAALDKGRDDGTVSSLSCAAEACSAGGSYGDGSGHAQAFVVTWENGRWGKAIEVPGSAALNKGGGARVSSVSCAAAASCSAGGLYQDGAGHFQAFVVSRT